MWPIVGELWPGVLAGSYGVCLALALAGAGMVLLRTSARGPLGRLRMARAALALVIGALCGAMVLPALAALSRGLGSDGISAVLWSARLSYYGAVFGGVLAVVAVERLSAPLALDALAVPVALVHCGGKIGCLLRGCCFGKSGGLWSLSFGPASVAYETHEVWGVLPERGHTAGLHPVQLYEGAVVLALIPGLLWLEGRRRFAGQVAASYLGLYALARLVLEVFRGDRGRGFVGSPVAWVEINRWFGVDGGSATVLSVPQLGALVTALGCFWAYLLLGGGRRGPQGRSRSKMASSWSDDV